MPFLVFNSFLFEGEFFCVLSVLLALQTIAVIIALLFENNKTHTAQRMKEENLFRRRFSLCPNTSTPQKIDPHKLTRNLSYGGDNDIYPLSPGRCWMDAIELALSCSSLYKLSSKQGKDVDLCCSSNSSHILNLLQSSTLSHQEVFQMNESGNHHMENDGYSDKSDCGANESSRRLTEESDTDQSQTQKDVLVELQATSYVEQGREEMAEAGVASQTETVSEENKGLMWTILKQLRPGMDLSRVVLPTFILEPRSFLDKLSDYYYHADFLSQASVEEIAYSRMKQVLRWYLSGFYKKPKVSHHPPVSAFYVCNKKDGFCVSGSILAKSKFYGNSLSAVLDGKAMLFFLKRDEEYIITMPYAHCRGILYGTMTMELGGKVTIECEKTKYTAELEFKLKPFLCIGSSVNMISGRILLGDELQATIDGHWDGEVFLCEKSSGDRSVFWSPTPEVRRQRLKRQVVHLGNQGEFESERLWLHVTNAIISKDQHKATQEKFILEEAQRQAARDQGDREWTPRLFRKDPISQDWLYKYADTNPWDPQMNLVEFEKDGVIQTLGTDGRRHSGISHSKKWATKQKTDCKRRKTSQNTESSSSTPDPSHESSDNESRNTGIAMKQRGTYLAKRLGLDTIWFGYLQTTVGIIQLLGGPVFGRFADLHGARAALTLSSLSSAVYFMILGCATNVPLLFISKLPAVFMHGLPGVQMVVTDLTEPGNRASALSRLGLCFGVGMIVGSSLGGSLSTRYG
ncbi:UNVERIFIED_CONTAM: hypothetical protein FKN15_003306 [Acipenser sinensis]